VLRCGYKSTVKLLFIPPNRGVGIEASAHTTVVDVVGDEVVEDVVEVVEDVVDVVDEVEDVGEVDVVDDEQVVDGVVESTADAGAIRYGPKNSSDMTANIATKRIFFMNMTIVMFMKRDVRRNSSEI
jgi:hypothetical protein